MLSQILVGLLTGSVGVGYFMYGKKRSRFVPMLAGAALCLYPYAVSNLFWLLVVGAALLALPFMLKV